MSQTEKTLPPVARTPASRELNLHAPISARQPKPVAPSHLKWVIGAAIGLVILGAFTVGHARSGSDSSGGQWVAVKHASIPPILRELGYVGARTETRVFSGFTGEVIWKIDEGTEVKGPEVIGDKVIPGTVIMRFESEKAKDEIVQLQQDLYQKQETVKSAELSLKITEARYELENGRLEDEVSKARLDHELLFNMPKPEDRRQSELNLKTAQVNYALAVKDKESYELLFKEGFATNATLRQKELTVATKNVDLVKAMNLHRITMKGATNEQRRQAILKVKDAEKSLAASKFNRVADRKAAEATLELARIDLDVFKATLDEKVRNIDEAEVKAPASGRVAYINVFKGSQKSQSPIQIGETRNRGSDLCKIVDSSKPTVKLLVNEADLPRIKEDQIAIVRLPAFPGRAMQAHVVEIGRVSQDKNMALSLLALQKSGEAFINVCQVVLAFDNLSETDRNELKQGYTAEVFIQGRSQAVGGKADVQGMVVPFAAVQFDPVGKSYVWASTDRNHRERKDVTLGRSDGMNIEILTGLQDGDYVLDLAAVDATLVSAKKETQP